MRGVRILLLGEKRSFLQTPLDSRQILNGCGLMQEYLQINGNVAAS